MFPASMTAMISASWRFPANACIWVNEQRQSFCKGLGHLLEKADGRSYGVLSMPSAIHLA
jgi:hypothetical protein